MFSFKIGGGGGGRVLIATLDQALSKNDACNYSTSAIFKGSSNMQIGLKVLCHLPIDCSCARSNNKLVTTNMIFADIVKSLPIFYLSYSFILNEGQI